MVERTAIFGASGTGKSTLLRQLLRSHRRVVTFDPMAEHGEAVEDVRALDAVIRRRWRSGWRVAYVPPAGGEAETLHVISVYLRRLQEASGAPAPITLAVEEMNLSYPVASLPRSLHGFADLCSRGRHWNIGLVGLSQRPAEVGTRFRGNLSSAYVLRLPFSNDRAAVEQFIGSKHRAAIEALPNFEALHMDAAGTVRRVHIRR